MTTPRSLKGIWLEERTPVTIPEGAELTPLYELADQDGWQGGTAFLTKKGKVVAVEGDEVDNLMGA